MTDEPGFWQQRAMLEHDRFLDERDRRYAEQDRRYSSEALLRAEALKIRHEEQQAALNLARIAQAYRDEQANKLREQINSERNVYVTKTEQIASEEKMEALIKPLADALQQSQGSAITKSQLLAYGGFLVIFIGFISALMNGRL